MVMSALPNALSDLPTPALLLDWPVALRNIETAARFVDGKPVRLRPHFKNHKCPTLAIAQLAGGGCVGMTVATVAEAAALVDAGMDDILIANEVVGTAKIARLVDLSERAVVRVVVDTFENAQTISKAAIDASTRIGTLVEIDIGSHRCGVSPGAPVLALTRRLLDLPGLRFDGLHAYHGHVVGNFDRAERDAAARETMIPAIESRHLLESDGIACGILTGAGTATFYIVGEMDDVDELQIGSYVTMDWSYTDRVGDMFDIALTVLASVISATTDRFVLDVGVKGVADEYGHPRILDHPEFEVPRFRAEEHTIVHAPNHGIRVGDRVRVLPSHCCTTCNLHRQIVLHEGETVRDVWPMYSQGYGLDEYFHDNP